MSTTGLNGNRRLPCEELKNYAQWGKLRTGGHIGHGEGIGVDDEISG